MISPFGPTGASCLMPFPKRLPIPAALGMGEASVVMEDGTRRTAACIGGMLSVMNGTCRLLATTWEWKEDIDAERAQAAKKRAEEMIAKGGLTDQEYKMASAKLQRALVRLSVKE